MLKTTDDGLVTMEIPYEHNINDILRPYTINKFIKQFREGVNESQLTDPFRTLLADAGIPYKVEDNRIDILTPMFNIEAKFYDIKHKDKQFNEIISQEICYQRKRKKDGKPLSSYLIAMSNKRASIIPIGEVMSLINTINWDDKTRASKILPSRVKAVERLKLSYNSYNMMNDDIKTFISRVVELERLQKTTVTKEMIFGDFLQYFKKTGMDHKNGIESYIYKLYNSGFENKTRCLLMSEEEAYLEIIQKHAAYVINQSAETELHKHVSILEHIKQNIDSNLSIYNPEEGGILIGYATEILMYVNTMHNNHTEENIAFYTEHVEEAYNTNIKRIEIMTEEITKDNKIDTNKDIGLCMGNPPWELDQDREFFTKIVSAHNFVNGGCIDLIMNASFLSGTKAISFRNLLIAKGSVEEITIFTSNSFLNSSTHKPIGKVGCRIRYIKGKPQRDDVKIIRNLGNGHETEATTCHFTREEGAILYFGEPLKQIHNRFVTGDADFHIDEYGNGKVYDPNGIPNLQLSKCSNVNHVGKDNKNIGDLRGRDVVSPPTIDRNGTKVYNGTSGQELRVIEVEKGQEHLLDNISYHMQTRLFGFIFMQVFVAIRTISRRLEPLLSTVLTDKFENFEDYETALYDDLQLTVDVRQYIENLGVTYKPYIDKDAKEDTAITYIERSTKRVKITGEVFTPDDIVNKAIFDMRYYLHDKSKYIIEPSCGEGAYVVAMIKDRKEHGLTDIENIKNMRGFDIMEDNVEHTRGKILELLEDTPQIRELIAKNVQCGDFKLWDLEADEWGTSVEEFVGDIYEGAIEDDTLTGKVSAGNSLELFDM